MSRKAKRKNKSSGPKVTTLDTYNGEESAGDHINSFITTILFLGTWLVLGTIITLWLADKGLVIFLAVVLELLAVSLLIFWHGLFVAPVSLQ